MQRAIVNLATEGGRFGWYRKGQRRLADSLRGRFDGRLIRFGSEAEVGAPGWDNVSAGFKLYSIRKAYQMGFPVVLWLDASMFAINDVSPIFEQIEEQGYCLEYTMPWIAGEWCSDAAMMTMGLDRETMVNVKEVWACMVGINFLHPAGVDLFRQWWQLCHDGVTFIGAYTNENGEVSKDKRVKGHRQDQSALSGLAYKYNLNVNPYGTFFETTVRYRHGEWGGL